MGPKWHDTGGGGQVYDIYGLDPKGLQKLSADDTRDKELMRQTAKYFFF